MTAVGPLVGPGMDMQPDAKNARQVPMFTRAALTFSRRKRPVARFAELTLDESKDYVALPTDFLAELSINRRLYFGDHWLDGIGWIGPWPRAREGASRDALQLVWDLQMEIIRGFTARNGIAEGVDRHQTGVNGIEPKWTWTPDGIRVRSPRQLRTPRSAPPPPPRIDAPPAPGEPPPRPEPPEDPEATAREQQRAKIEQLNSEATKWWDTRDIPSLLQTFTRVLLYGRMCTLQLRVPDGLFVPEMSDNKPTGRLLLRVKDVADAFSKIYVDVLEADAGRVVQDPQTLAEIGVRISSRGDGDEVATVTYLDDNGQTVLAAVDRSSGPEAADANKKPAPAITFDLGGRLLMHTAVRDAPFVTEQARQAQYSLNYATSVIPRNLTTAGFQERALANVDVAGEHKMINGRRVFVPDPIVRGPWVVNVHQGVQNETADGAKTRATPVIHDRDPVDPTGTILAKNEAYADLLHELDQIHILIAGDAVTSGVSREQARADHVSAMLMTKSLVERAGRWLLETATALAYSLATPARTGGAQAIAGLRMAFLCYLDPGPLPATERAQNTADVGAGTLSVETAIERNQIADVDAELERIDNGKQLDLETKRAAVFQAWVTAGADEAYAAWRAGLSPDEAARLMAGFQPPPEPPPPGNINPDDTGAGGAAGAGVGAGAGAGGGGAGGGGGQ